MRVQCVQCLHLDNSLTIFQMYNDFIENPTALEYASLTPPESAAFLALPKETSYADKSLEKAFIALSKPHYAAHVEPSMKCAKRCGNMYTGSLYGGLASLLSTVPPDRLLGKRIAMFAFGGGCAASYWGITVKGDISHISAKIDLLARLNVMRVATCEEFVHALKVYIRF